MTLAARSFRALGSTATVVACTPRALEVAVRIVAAEVAAIDAACSRFRADSELTRVNAAAGTGPAAAGPLLLEAVRVALAAAAASGGLVDPTVGRSLRLAGYDRTFELVRRRDGASLAVSFAPVPGWRRVELHERAGTIALPAGAELDLGATAKALAADRAAVAAVRGAGCGVLVALGGDIAVAGEPPAGGWPVRIADDHAAPLDGAGPVVAVHAGGLATSGTSVRRWRAAGIELHHLIDPRTGRPAVTPWRTVSVAGRSCVQANVAATAAVVLGEGAPGWLAARGLPARLVRDSGSVTHVAGWPAEEAVAA